MTDDDIKEIEEIVWLESIQRQLQNPDTCKQVRSADLTKAKIVAEEQVFKAQVKLMDYVALSRQVSQQLYFNRVKAEISCYDG